MMIPIEPPEPQPYDEFTGIYSPYASLGDNPYSTSPITTLHSAEMSVAFGIMGGAAGTVIGSAIGGLTTLGFGAPAGAIAGGTFGTISGAAIGAALDYGVQEYNRTIYNRNLAEATWIAQQQIGDIGGEEALAQIDKIAAIQTESGNDEFSVAEATRFAWNWYTNPELQDEPLIEAARDIAATDWDNSYDQSLIDWQNRIATGRMAELDEAAYLGNSLVSIHSGSPLNQYAFPFLDKPGYEAPDPQMMNAMEARRLSYSEWAAYQSRQNEDFSPEEYLELRELTSGWIQDIHPDMVDAGLPITEFREVHALMNDIELPYLDVGKELPTSPMIGEPDIDPRERIFHWGTAAQIGTDGVGGLFDPGSTMGLFDVGPDGELIPQHTELNVEAETEFAIADLDDLRAEAERVQGTYEIEVLMSLIRLGGDPTMAPPLGLAEEPPAPKTGLVQPGIIGGPDLTPDPPPNLWVGPIAGGPDPTQDRGGVIAFAGGGVVGSGGGLSLIGEEGPELLEVPAGSYIHSNMSTEGLLADLGGYGGGPETHYHSTEIHINGIRDVQSLLRELRREMRYQGMGFVEVGRGGRLR